MDTPEGATTVGASTSMLWKTSLSNVAKELFDAEHVNVQPHSGAQANMAAYFALLEPGDTIMGMRLDHGGHLTHGSNVNFSGKLYEFVPYGVDRDSEAIDYDEVERLALEHRPKVIVAGCSSYSRILDFPGSGQSPIRWTRP